MALPVVEIVTIANMLAEVSGKLFKTYKNRKRVQEPDPDADPKEQVQTLLAQLRQMETVQEKQAEIVVQLTEQMQSVTLALAEQARRTAQARWALGISLVALAVSLGVWWSTRG